MTARNRFLNLAAIAVGVLLLSGCAQTEFVSTWMKKITWPGQEETAGTYKIGKPYRVGSVWYYPQQDFHLVETGIASWYGPDFHGHRTANGELYDQSELTGAHRTLQMPSLVRVTNLENGRSVVIRINDRGPYLHGRIIDVSKRAAELLGFIGKGTARVRLEVMTRESQEMAEAAKRGMDTSRLTMADLQKYDTTQPPEAQPVSLSSARPVPPQEVLPEPEVQVTRGPQVASRQNDSDALPESLQTPTITVEQLAAPPSDIRHAPPVDTTYVAPSQQPVQTQQNSANGLNVDEQESSPPTTSSRGSMTQGHLEEGHFMPDPVVSQGPVTPTGIFVQAGAFAVRANADRLKQNLSGVAPVLIDAVNANGRTLYRVKLGPLPSVAKADAVLERVIALGNNTARVVHAK